MTSCNISGILGKHPLVSALCPAFMLAARADDAHAEAQLLWNLIWQNLRPKGFKQLRHKSAMNYASKIQVAWASKRTTGTPNCVHKLPKTSKDSPNGHNFAYCWGPSAMRSTKSCCILMLWGWSPPSSP